MLKKIAITILPPYNEGRVELSSTNRYFTSCFFNLAIASFTWSYFTTSIIGSTLCLLQKSSMSCVSLMPPIKLPPIDFRPAFEKKRWPLIQIRVLLHFIVSTFFILISHIISANGTTIDTSPHNICHIIPHHHTSKSISTYTYPILHASTFIHTCKYSTIIHKSTCKQN